MASEAKKCGHPNCTCMVTGKEYCSAQCEAMEHTPDIDCTCTHAECRGRATAQTA
jgi:hypothetical protein